MIGLEQPVERQQGREQCCDPYDPDADPLEDHRLGPYPQWKQHDRQNKKAEDDPSIAAVAQGEAQVAPEEADKGHHLQTTAAVLGRGANAWSSVSRAVPSSIGKWGARTTRPPRARCAAMACSRRS